jgi:crotonobetainyl-CoA:carnitine CoA-transferase CaiB-like acyl-CoA transferase
VSGEAGSGPLTGLQILDLTRLLPGPYATLVLADLGADVVKVEEPEAGDYLRMMPPMAGDISGLFHLLNRNKRSIALDLKQPAGRETFFKLLERFDVVVESFRPGVMDRLGVGYEALRQRQPRTILCSITGYGQDGPYRDRAGHDIDYQALGGLVFADGTARPKTPLSQVGDIGGGSWPAVVGILAAAWERERTGRGRAIDISMTEGCLAFLATELGRWPSESGGHSVLGGEYPCYRVYRASDGHHLALGALEPKFWQAFCRAVGKPDWVVRQFEEEAIVDEVQALFSTRTRAEWLEFLAPSDVCCEPVLEREEIFDHPVHRARGTFFEVEGLGTKLRHTRTPVRVSGAEVPRRPPPALGQHTAAVLAEAGFPAAEIAKLNATGAIRCPTAT